MVLGLLTVVWLVGWSYGHLFSTLFTAQDVNQYLSTDSGIDSAIAWCKAHSIDKHVWIEAYRDGILVDRNILINAKQKFEAVGYNVSGCVCTTQIGKHSNNWNLATCYTNSTSQQELKSIFQFTASVFDTIIIDDFYFTDCSCNECTSALAAHEVNVDGHISHFEDTIDGSCYDHDQPCTWKDYRRLLMFENSRWNVLDATKQVNPNVNVIIKYPDWYDVYQDFGYDTFAQSNLFPGIWIGTEFREYQDALKPPYFAFFNMRWLGEIGAGKAGGGWYDSIDTTPPTFLEQARMTILGGAKESFLFHYGDFLSGEGLPDIEYLNQNIPELQNVANEVATRMIKGVAAYKPPNSHGGCIVDPEHSNQCKGETYIFDFVGMLGIPLQPTFFFPNQSPSAFFSTHALKDERFVPQLNTYLDTGRPVLVTDELSVLLSNQVNFTRPNVYILPVNNYPPSLLSNPPSNLDTIRNALLKPLGLQFTAPVNTSLFPFTDGSWVIENFSDNSVTSILNGVSLSVPGRGWVYNWV